MPPFDFSTLGLLLLVACIVAILSDRLRLPYSVGLVAAGVLLALARVDIDVPLTRELIFYLFLPPLVFEAAIQIPWRPFRRELPLLAALATVGVVIATAVVAAGMHWLAGWSWLGAAFFGVLIAATDPVSVIAAFKKLAVERRLHLLVESESLLNDGVAAVGFALLAGIAAGAAPGPGAIALELVATAFGAVLIGGGVALTMILIAGRSNDRLVEITLTMVIAYGAFMLAETLHASGVIATLTAGLIVGNRGFGRAITEDGRAGILHHWEFVAFLINSLIFLLIGAREVAMPITTILQVAAIATALSLLGRAASVYPLALLFAPGRLRVPLRYQHILVWGGLRGALALALALALPPSVAERTDIVTVSFAVVAFSIFVQGLSMPWLIHRLGLLRDMHDKGAET